MYTISAIVWKEIYTRISYKRIILIGLIAINIVMVLLPLTAYYLGGTTLGYSLCLLLCAAIGFFNNSAQLSFLALINFMSLDIVNIFNQGIAVSGVIMVSLRMVILGIKGADSNNFGSIVIYMVLTIVVNTGDIVLNVRFFASEYYKKELEGKQFAK